VTLFGAPPGKAAATPALLLPKQPFLDRPGGLNPSAELANPISSRRSTFVQTGDKVQQLREVEQRFRIFESKF
jgi:hypothetical protein